MIGGNTKELLTFIERCQLITDKWYDDKGYPRCEKFSFIVGKRYIKLVFDGRAAHCFVNRENGDVFKAASWSTPAKHARGNIFDGDNGLGMMEAHGPKYLR